MKGVGRVTLPAAVLRTTTHILRPRDLAGTYANPSKEVARLVRQGALREVATGYYLVPPPDRMGNPDWRPALEDLALALAIADYGQATVALMGVTAARMLGALPRALGMAVVAVPKQRPQLVTRFGTIIFVQRDVARLGLTRATARLTQGYMTDVEQTALDLAQRPDLGDLEPREVGEALLALAPKIDWNRIRDLAERQHLRAAYMRARWVVAPALDIEVPALSTRRPVEGRNLRVFLPRDADLGIQVPNGPADAPTVPIEAG